MRDFSLAAAGLFAAVAPLGALPVFLAFARGSTARQRLTAIALVAAASFALMAAAAAIAGPVLDWLEVSGENFQLAAAAVMLPLAARLLWSGRSISPPRGGDRPRLMRAWLMPLTLPLLAGPTPLVATMCYSARFDAGVAIGAAALVMVVTSVLLATSAYRAWAVGGAVDILGRFNGALLVIVAVELFVDGVQSV